MELVLPGPDASSGPYDRVIVTCGITGLSPHWLDQLTPSGRIVAPVAHGGVHPVLVVSTAERTIWGSAALWADCMPAAGAFVPGGAGGP